MTREQVRVPAFGDSGSAEDLLDQQRRPPADVGVFEHDRIAQHQVRGCEPGHLIVGEVPRHHPEQGTDRQRFDPSSTGNRRRDLIVRGQSGSVDAVVIDDVGGELDLVNGLGIRLAHLDRDRLREFVLAFVEDLRGPPHDSRSFLNVGVLPRQIRGVSGGDSGFDLGIRCLGEGLEDLPGRGILNTVVRHSCSFACPGRIAIARLEAVNGEDFGLRSLLRSRQRTRIWGS